MTNTQEMRRDINMVVASNVRAGLARERWSGRKAATALGLTPMYVSRRLSGETPMDANDILMFAQFLHVSVNSLFKDPGNAEPLDYKSQVSAALIDFTAKRNRKHRPTNRTGQTGPKRRAA